ncbi:MAG TPA: hypothetical protein VJV03_17205 [Pyrinomonadaceae bacterium]|nr:hypothetical protein [Pyrinomonadaceae bacterium]
MTHSKIMTRLALTVVVAVAGFASANVTSVQAQEGETSKRPARRTAGGRDPFSKYVPPRAPVKKSGLVLPPTIQERIEQYKAQKQAAMRNRVAAPKPTTAFLLNELQVLGVSRSPRGYAAIVEATPIKLAYVIYPGEQFYDGQLVAIEDNRLVFRRETVFANGKRERTVEMKSLRQPSTVETLSALKTASTAAASSAPEKSQEPKETTEKP